MNLSPTDLHQLADLAISAATEAGQLIAQSRPAEVHYKASGTSLASQVVTEIDRRSESLIVEILGPTFERFELGLLTEEREDDLGRLATDFFWCIDPLDGTLPFIESLPGYAVSIALVASDGFPWIGVVYDPVESTVLHAISGAGAFRNSVSLTADQQPTANVLSVFADRSFLARDDHGDIVDALEQLTREMGLSELRLDATGGAVMNACRVLAHSPACYFKKPKPTGGGSVWDFAATACLFHEAGAVATDIYGNSLDLNRADSSYMNHRGVLYASDKQLARRIRALHRSTD